MRGQAAGGAGAYPALPPGSPGGGRMPPIERLLRRAVARRHGRRHSRPRLPRAGRGLRAASATRPGGRWPGERRSRPRPVRAGQGPNVTMAMSLPRPRRCHASSVGLCAAAGDHSHAAWAARPGGAAGNATGPGNRATAPPVLAPGAWRGPSCAERASPRAHSSPPSALGGSQPGAEATRHCPSLPPSGSGKAGTQPGARHFQTDRH